MFSCKQRLEINPRFITWVIKFKCHIWSIFFNRYAIYLLFFYAIWPKLSQYAMDVNFAFELILRFRNRFFLLTGKFCLAGYAIPIRICMLRLLKYKHKTSTWRLMRLHYSQIYILNNFESCRMFILHEN